MSTADYSQHTFTAMGTTCQIMVQAPSHATAETFFEKAISWVSGFERRYSRFIPDSLISRINLAAGRDWVEIDPETESLFGLCDWFHWSTKGVFDPAVLPLLRIWDYHSPRATLPDDQSIRDARALSGWTKLQRRKGEVFLPQAGMGLDVGGIGKEYAVDRIFEMAVASGFQNILVNFGQDLRVQGEPPEGGPWRIGIEDPGDSGKCWAGVALRNRAVTTSGNYHRNMTIGGEQFGHILDPRTGMPARTGAQAVTVIAPTCTEAGILSTSAFILGGNDGIEFLDAYFQAEGCIKESNRRYVTRRFNETLITK